MQTDHGSAPGALLARITTAIALLDAGEIDAAEQAALSLCGDYPRLTDGFTLHARCADAVADRKLALARWRVCEERFASDPGKWRLGLGYACLNMGKFADAAHAFDVALATNPQLPAALAGQAMVMGRIAPGTAESLWRALFNLVEGPPKPNWQISRSAALAESGQIEQAIAVLHQVIDGMPTCRGAYAMLPPLLMATGRKAETAEELQTGRWRVGGGATHLERTHLLRWTGDIEGARVSLLAAINAARTATELVTLLPLMPSLFQTYERGEAWRALRTHAANALPPDEAATVGLQMRIDIALRDYDAFLLRMKTPVEHPEPWKWRFDRLAAILRAPAFPDFAAPKVFGIGLSKTGTSSLGLALDRLGYLQAHFHSPFTQDILADADFILFDAASDTPVSARFEMLYAMFPNARFILTERPKSSWVGSFHDHFEHWHGDADAAFRTQSYADLKNCVWGLDRALIHGGLYASHEDAAASHDAHTSRVERFFADKPAHKLLRLNIFGGEGWTELCNFLGHAVRQEPFPWTNRAPRHVGQALPPKSG